MTQWYSLPCNILTSTGIEREANRRVSALLLLLRQWLCRTTPHPGSTIAGCARIGPSAGGRSIADHCSCARSAMSRRLANSDHSESVGRINARPVRIGFSIRRA
jgi:hypothetical protein